MTTLVHITTVPMTLDFLDGQIAFMKRRGFQVALISSPDPLLERIGRQAGVAEGPEMRSGPPESLCVSKMQSVRRENRESWERS